MLINVPFIVISLIKTVVVKIHKLHKMYNIDGVNSSQCFHNTLIISRLCSCQFLNISFLMLYINKQSRCWSRVVYLGSAYKQQPTIIVSIGKVLERV